MYNYFCISRVSAPVAIRARNRPTTTRETRFIPVAKSAIADRIA
jgi:hypothetical protein